MITSNIVIQDSLAWVRVGTKLRAATQREMALEILRLQRLLGEKGTAPPPPDRERESPSLAALFERRAR